MSVSPNKTLRRALVVAGALLLAGCSRSILTAPATDSTSASTNERGVAQVPPPANLLGGVLNTVDKLLNWTTVVQTLVLKNNVAVVTGHRWSLEFEKGSLSADATITIQDYDPNVLDVQFGPHGTQFPVPVTLSIDLSNTDADPSVPRYNGCEPQLYWLNVETNKWEEIPGRLDAVNKKLIVKLPHFSRYVVGSKAGWKHQPQKQDD